TSYGLTCINIDNFKLSVYNQEYGLSNLQFNYNSLMKDPSGNLYFGSTNGLIKFHPDSIFRYKANQTVVPIYMNNLRSSKKEFFFNDIPNNQQITYIKYPAIKLAHDESSFQIEFAALNYVDAASTSYEYRLNGFDSEWKLSRINQIFFSRIPP